MGIGGGQGESYPTGMNGQIELPVANLASDTGNNKKTTRGLDSVHHIIHGGTFQKTMRELKNATLEC